MSVQRRALLAAQDAAIAALRVGAVLSDARAAAVKALQVPFASDPFHGLGTVWSELMSAEGVVREWWPACSNVGNAAAQPNAAY